MQKRFSCDVEGASSAEYASILGIVRAGLVGAAFAPASAKTDSIRNAAPQLD